MGRAWRRRAARRHAAGGAQRPRRGLDRADLHTIRSRGRNGRASRADRRARRPRIAPRQRGCGAVQVSRGWKVQGERWDGRRVGAGPKGRTGAPGRRVFARAARRHRAPPRASARRATSQNTQKPICGALSAPHAPAPRLRPLDDLRPKGAEHGSRSRRAGEKPRARGGSGSGGRDPPRSGAPAWPRLGASGPRRGEALEKLERPSADHSAPNGSTWTGARRRRGFEPLKDLT